MKALCQPIGPTWERTRPAPATLADLYLDRHRGYRSVIPPTIRFVPALRHAPSGLMLPVMVAAVAVWPSHEITAIHCTYLNPNTGGKAAAEPVKMMLGQAGGGAVRLAECGERLAISEGIETGLIAQFATGIPTWAALSAAGMEAVVLPPLPLAAEVFILADDDERGIKAAKVLARRLVPEGRTVRIAIPEKIGADWADVLSSQDKVSDAA
jgi:putative DNA primase/helicase